MPSIKISGVDTVITMFARLSNEVEGICKQGLYDGAGVIADAIKAACPVDTGDMQSSVGIAKFRVNGTQIDTVIGFDDYDRKGVANAVKARALESGTSRIRKRPFIRPAVNRAKAAAEAAIAAKIDSKIQEITKEA